jgi:hypothetical protein
MNAGTDWYRQKPVSPPLEPPLIPERVMPADGLIAFAKREGLLT